MAAENYGQGSSREHAALASRSLSGRSAVIAKSFARIQWQNLANFGVLPLTFVHPRDGDEIDQADLLRLENLPERLKADNQTLTATNETKNKTYQVEHALTERQIEMIRAGSLVNLVRQEDHNENSRT